MLYDWIDIQSKDFDGLLSPLSLIGLNKKI